jgi:2-hydroxychromene-2-carboxylate isomerase
VTVRWRPFLLGPIFQSQGWTTSPFNLYPAKGRYMVRDIERIATSRGLRFSLPSPFPANGLYAARVAIVGLAEGWTPAFSREAFRAQFEHGEDITDWDVLLRCLERAGADPEAAKARAMAQETKDALRAHTDEAAALGLFGAPSFVTPDEELFWGDDRLEAALEWTGNINE